ncbi:MAG: TIGR04282 family arsenosugar biosynthesis glycosyltransferase [Candidatus Azotimanducaceae bacterium WSBS_2022_MAG_OTU7]
MKNAEPLIQIFCKAPVPGEVKTRLVPKLGEQAALDLYLEMLQRLLSALMGTSFALELWITPTTGHTFFEEYPVARRQQSGTDLGARMSNALNDGLTRHHKVLLVGTDLPLIDASYINLAVECLGKNDAVLGPAEDGGYGLIGVSENLPGIFSNIDWGTDQVLSQTCIQLNQRQLIYGMLPLIWDVDRPGDLPRYRDWLNKTRVN